MAQFRIPGPLRRLADGHVTVDVEATNLVGAIVALDAQYPGFKDRLLDENGDLRQFVNIYLNDEDIRLGSGLGAKVGEKDEISIVPAVAGGIGRYWVRHPGNWSEAGLTRPGRPRRVQP